MHNANDLFPAGSSAPTARGGQARRDTPAAYLARLPSLELSETGRRNVAAQFGLSDTELSAALATAQRQKGGRP